MLRYLIVLELLVVLFTVASKGLTCRNCSHDFHEVEERILNGSLGVLLNISSAFFPTREKEAEYLVIHYFYTLDSGSNHSVDYVWVSSSVYLVVEPNALEDLTVGILDVTQGSLTIDLQCLCPPHPNDVTAIISRVTAYLRCYAITYAKITSDDDDECKTNSFIRRFDDDDPLYEKVLDVMYTIKAVAWLSIILMLFLQVGALNTLYAFILKSHKKCKKCKDALTEFKKTKSAKSLLGKKSKVTKNQTEYHLLQDQNKGKLKKIIPAKDYLPMAWATVYVAFALLVVIILRDIHSELVDCDSTSNHDYKDLYIGVYATWMIGLVIAIYFPKCTCFPVPIITTLFEKLNMMESKLFATLTFISQSLMIWVLFCLVQLLTLHGIFFFVSLLAKPVAVLVALSYIITFVLLAISATSIMFEVVTLERINPRWRNKNGSTSGFIIYNYLKDLPNFIGSVLLSIFILALVFLSYQFDDKLGSTLDFTGAPAAVAGTIHSIFFFLVSIALRKQSFRDLFEVRDTEEPEGQEETMGQEETKGQEDESYGTESTMHAQTVHINKISVWPHKFLYRDCEDDDSDSDDDCDGDHDRPSKGHSINSN